MSTPVLAKFCTGQAQGVKLPRATASKRPFCKPLYFPAFSYSAHRKPLLLARLGKHPQEAARASSVPAVPANLLRTQPPTRSH